MRMLRLIVLCLLVVFILPSLLSAGLWWIGEHPRSWREADWTSARLLPRADASADAAVYIFAARTGGLKGAVSTHSWIVVKEKGSSVYQRFDKAGWGSPIKTDNWPADARWYSNEPQIVTAFHAEAAEALIPKIRSAIADYPYSRRGDYRIFPGPNSNTFVAYVLRSVPELHTALPATAIGRDFPDGGSLATYDPALAEIRLSLFGYAGLVIGRETGLEINLLGLVAGIDPFDGLMKIPAFGEIGVTMPAPATAKTR